MSEARDISVPRDSASPLHASSLDERNVPPLGWTGSTFVQVATSTIRKVEELYSSWASRPTLSSVAPGYLQRLLPAEAPQYGEAWEDIERDVERAIMPGLVLWQSPKFMALFPASSTYPGILGDIYAAAFTTPGFNWACAPAHTELEIIVMDWLAKMMDLPEAFRSTASTGGGGILQGSASEGVLVSMIAARERLIRRRIAHEGISDANAIEARSHELKGTMVALASEHAHSCSQKAAMILGLRFRTVPATSSDNLAMSGADLRSKIESIIAQGLQPMFVTVALGTTGTCAIDDLLSIADVVKDYPDVWVHCDAAYAGAALVCPEYQYLSRQLAFVDSIDINLHKWLLTNHDASCLYIRQRDELINALSVTRTYLNNDFSNGNDLITDFRDWQIPLGRRFRSLKVWFIIRTYGIDGMQRHIHHHITLGNLFASLVRSRNDLFTIFCEPAFALTVFTVNQPRSACEEVHPAEEGTPHAVANGSEITQRVFTRINAQKEYALTGLTINQVYVIRVCPSTPLAEEKYVRQVFDLLVLTTLEELRAL